MRLVTFETDGRVRVGVKKDGKVADTGYADIITFILDGENAVRAAAHAAEAGQWVEQYRLLAPVLHPGKVLCGGINYASHKDENPNAKFPERPSFFSKLTNSIIGTGDAIVIPERESQVDYEVELALVIGRTARKISKEDALDYVFAYTVLNDVSGRDLQFQLQHETIGKGADTFCPMGPVLVLKQEIPDPSKLRLASYVNGELRQSSEASDMIFDIPTLLECLTSYVTLHPGDVVSTGTPAGVGFFRNPPVFLKPGDRVEVEVTGIGRLSNPVIQGWEESQ